MRSWMERYKEWRRMSYSGTILSRICISSMSSGNIEKSTARVANSRMLEIHLSDSFAWKYLINSERSNETHGMLHEWNANWTMKWKCHLGCIHPLWSVILIHRDLLKIYLIYFKGELDKRKSKRILQICTN